MEGHVCGSTESRANERGCLMHHAETRSTIVIVMSLGPEEWNIKTNETNLIPLPSTSWRQAARKMHCMQVRSSTSMLAIPMPESLGFAEVEGAGADRVRCLVCSRFDLFHQPFGRASGLRHLNSDQHARAQGASDEHDRIAADQELQLRQAPAVLNDIPPPIIPPPNIAPEQDYDPGWDLMMDDEGQVRTADGQAVRVGAGYVTQDDARERLLRELNQLELGMYDNNMPEHVDEGVAANLADFGEFRSARKLCPDTNAGDYSNDEGGPDDDEGHLPVADGGSPWYPYPDRTVCTLVV